jgi:hypothetical protein
LPRGNVERIFIRFLQQTAPELQVLANRGPDVTSDNKKTYESGLAGKPTIPSDNDLIVKPSDLLAGDILL